MVTRGWWYVRRRIRSTHARKQTHLSNARALGIHAAVHEEPLMHGEVNSMLGTPGAYTDVGEAFMKTLDADVRRLLQASP